jgi:hypothetical protein
MVHLRARGWRLRDRERRVCGRADSALVGARTTRLRAYEMVSLQAGETVYL